MQVRTADPARERECNMRIATVLLFMIISWVCLGYLLSDNINTHRGLAQVQQQVNQAAKDNKTIQDQLSKAISEKNDLKQRNYQLIQQNTELQEQVKQSQRENQDLKNKNSNLQGQLDVLKKYNLVAGRLTEFFPQSLIRAIFVPILPASLAATYAFYKFTQRYRCRNSSQENKRWQIISIRVTEAEMQQIVKMRRGKQ